MSETTGDHEATGVAGRLWDLLVHLYGEGPAVTVAAWDGSRAGDADDLVVHVRSRKTVRRLLWNPGEIGLARAYVTGELDIEGDLSDAVAVLREYEQRATAKGALGPADRREVLRTTVLLGAVGPAPRAPSDPLVAVHGYAAVDDDLQRVLPPEVSAAVLGDWSPSGDDELFVTYPDPLSAGVAAWEAAGRVVREVEDVTAEHSARLAEWASRLDEHEDDVIEVVGDRQTRVWRLSLVLDRDSLTRGRVRAYRIRA